MRHISWSATHGAENTTRQYQIERDQTILIAIDAGRLMTARIEKETKLDSAVHAALALMSAARAPVTTRACSFSAGESGLSAAQKGAP